MDPAPVSIQAPETIELSVIIQTRNRVGILMETLARLIEQETEVRFEGRRGRRRLDRRDGRFGAISGRVRARADHGAPA